MTIKTKIFTISTLFCLVVTALILPNHFLVARTRNLNQMLLHVQQEHVAVQKLLLLVGRELKEISDEVFLADREQLAGKLDEEIRATFARLGEFGRVHPGTEAEMHAPDHLNAEELMFKALEQSYAKMQTARTEIERLYVAGDLGAAKNLMEQVYENEYDHTFRAITDEWLREEAREMERCLADFNLFFSGYTRLNKFVGLVSIGLALLLSFLLYRFVSHRLTALQEGVGHAASGNLSNKLEVSGSDELAAVAKAFNGMTDRLATSQARLLEQCYLAGVNEASGAILHNLRSSFTHLLLTCDKLPTLIKALEDQAPAAPVAGLSRVVEKLQNSTADLQQVLRVTQQGFADEQGLQECGLRELINDSLNLLSRDYLEQIRFYIDPGTHRLGRVRTHRIVFIQILSNLITNACEAIRRQGEINGMVSISADTEEIQGEESIHLYVHDNGCGILPADLERIFQRRFSSKLRLRYGLTGLGLNWCRNAVTSLNGKLYAESSGAGKGATMHLIFSRDISVPLEADPAP